MKVKKRKPSKKVSRISSPKDKRISQQQYVDEKGMPLADDADSELPIPEEDVDALLKEEEEEYDHYYGE